ncbi:MAG: phosphodiester glycosidase family protein [Candidatus Eremiobacteraeota bacterium]|nr:phosphodiester glycosidase family protein [Candidatus Eremiobacteraeota bacterium]
MIRRFVSLLLLLTMSAGAEVELDKIVAVRQSVQGETVRLVIETEKRVPQASAFFLTGPDRLVVELNDALGDVSLGKAPAVSMVRSWALKPTALNRSTLTLNLAYAPISSDLKVSTVDSPPRVVVEFQAVGELREKYALTSGVTWIREDVVMNGHWTRLNRLLFDPADPQIEVMLGLAQEKTSAREPLSSMVRRYGALAGINGGFFASNGGALGLVYREGQMLAPHVSRRPPRSGFGLTKDKKALFGRIAATGEKIKDLDGGDWSGAWIALGGGPRLLQNGLAKITADLEELGPKGNDITRRAARTVVGMTKEGKLMFATVTGYHDNHKEGMQFGPLVGWLKNENVVEAVNFDGGASVDMVIGGHIVSDGPANRSKEKPVATALLVKDSRERLDCQQASWNFDRTSLPADGESESDLTVSLNTEAGKPVADGTPVRLAARGVRVDPASGTTKGGKFNAKVRSVREPGQAVLTLMAGPLTEQKTFTLQGGQTERFLVRQFETVPVKDKEELQKATVKVQALDGWGNPVKGEIFECSLDGGDKAQFTTGDNGIMALELDLPKSGGYFTVFHSSGEVRHNIAPLN